MDYFSICANMFKIFRKKLLLSTNRFRGAVNSNLILDEDISFEPFNSVQEEVEVKGE